MNRPAYQVFPLLSFRGAPDSRRNDRTCRLLYMTKKLYKLSRKERAALRDETGVYFLSGGCDR